MGSQTLFQCWLLYPTVLHEAPQSPQGAGSPPAPSATSHLTAQAVQLCYRDTPKTHGKKISFFYKDGWSVPWGNRQLPVSSPKPLSGAHTPSWGTSLQPQVTSMSPAGRVTADEHHPVPTP